MWFGTADGLNRFDGNNFKVFRHDPGNPNSIGSNAISYLFEDRCNRLWIGTSKGLYYYDGVLGKFTCLTPFANKYIRAIQDDAHGRLWFVAEGELYRFPLKIIDSLESVQKAELAVRKGDPSGLNPLMYPADLFQKIKIEDQSPTAMTTDEHDGIWLGTTKGKLIQFTNGTDRAVYWESPLLTGNSIENISTAGAGKLLIGTSGNGLLQLDSHTGQFTGPLLKNEQGSSEIFVRDIIRYKEDEFWVATEGGLYRYRTSAAPGKSSKFEGHIKKVYGDPFSLSDNALYTLCKDREGGIWIGSYFGGINYLANRPITFEKYFPGMHHPSFVGNAIREITEDQYGNFWIGTEDAGLNKADFKTGKFKHILPGSAGQAAHTNIHGMLADGSRLYVGTFEHGMDVMDIPSGKFIRHYKAGGDNGLQSNFINAILKTREGKYLVCTARGLYYFNPGKGKFSLAPGLPVDEFYSAIAEDHTGKIWIGTHTRGVLYLDNGRWRRLKIMTSGEDRLQNTRILYIKEDMWGRLWIATEDGLMRVTGQNKVKIFDSHSGLPSNIVYALVPDSLNNMWLTTSKGMVKINGKDDKVIVYNTADGLLNNQFNYQSGFQDKAGYIYFGSVKGLVRFNPYTYAESNYKPPLFITDFHIFNQEIEVDSMHSPLKTSILRTQFLELTHKQSTFSFDFAALSYSSPANLEFAYKMDGLDQNWTYLQRNRRIYFTNLAAGNYKLRIKSTNSSGIWVPNERVLAIRILPPFWRSNLAYLFYGLFFISLVGGAVYYNNRRHRLQAQRRMTLYTLRKEKELYQSKVDFFTHIAHEIRTPLTLIKGPMDQILREKEHLPHLEGYIDLMQRNTNRLLDLTYELLDFRKIESDMIRLDLQLNEMNGWLLNFITPYKVAAEEKGIHFLYIPPAMPFEAAIDESALSKMVNNLLDNALKYAENIVMVGLYTNVDQTHFSIQIDNDGHLVPEELHEKIFDPFFRWNKKRQIKGSGIGLFVANSLAGLHGGTLGFKITEQRYNTFLLSLPLARRQEEANQLNNSIQ